jgi:ABC-type nitrate/sulfonate/bicarbonate transport system substrate-binding protein
MPPHPLDLDRRRFLRLTGIAGGAALLAACGSGGESSGSGDGFGSVAMQLSWVKNVEFGGQYMADARGYFTQAGFSGVELLAGGAAGTSAETALVTGRAWIGISAPLITAPAIAQGAELKVVGATFQKNPFAVISLEGAPIPDARALIGKRIGVQDSNDIVWNALLAANGIEPGQVTRVPFQFDPTPITTGEVDGYVGYSTSGAATLTRRGFPATQFLFADIGLPLVGETLVVAQQTIDEERDKLKGFLTALARGWSDAVAEPAEAARLAAEVYGKDQNLDAGEQEAIMGRQAELIVSPETQANGLLTVSDELIAANMASLGLAGIDLPAEKLFDLAPLREVYRDNPGLGA